MAVFRNDFKEGRVVPHLGYHMVPDGETVIVPDEEYEHWVAGGWTPVDPSPAVAPAKHTKSKATEETAA